MKFLEVRNPFNKPSDDRLVNIVTGVFVSDEVNADDAIDIGEKIMMKIGGCKFGEIKLVKNEQVKTFKSMRKPLKIGTDEVHITSNELFHRMIATVLNSGTLPDDLFSYELSVVSPSMFHDDGTMRKTQKSLLMQYIVSIVPNLDKEICDPQGIVFDGGAMIHHLSWPKLGTMKAILDMYFDYVTNYQPRNASKVVVI